MTREQYLYEAASLRRALTILLTALAVPGLCGCASEEMAGRLAAAPDKYILWSCREMANEARAIAGREHDLEALMKKAEVDAGGRFVSAIAYQPEYNQLRGQMEELRKTAAEKNCNLSAGDSGVSGPPAKQPTFESTPPGDKL